MFGKAIKFTSFLGSSSPGYNSKRIIFPRHQSIDSKQGPTKPVRCSVHPASSAVQVKRNTFSHFSHDQDFFQHLLPRAMPCSLRLPVLQDASDNGGQYTCPRIPGRLLSIRNIFITSLLELSRRDRDRESVISLRRRRLLCCLVASPLVPTRRVASLPFDSD